MADTKKLNIIIRDISEIKNILTILIKNLNLDSESELELESILSKSEQSNQIQNESDESIIEWFREWAAHNEVDITGIDLRPLIKSLRYFRVRLPELTHPLKYLKTFLPKPKTTHTHEADELSETIMGLDRDTVLEKVHLLTPDIVKLVAAENPKYSQFLESPGKALKLQMLRNVITALAIKDGFIE